MNMVRIKPIAGRLVRDPITRKQLPPEGVVTELTPHWQRQINTGDVKIVVEEQSKPVKAGK